MTNIYIDLETIPKQPEAESKALIAETIKAPTAMKIPETIAAWHSGSGKYAGVKDAEIEKQYRNTSFKGASGEICSISVAGTEGDVFGMDARQNTEAELIQVIFDRIKILCNDHQKGSTPYFIGHWVGGFDLKFLYQRAVINKVQPSFKLPFTGWHGSDFFCTQSAWCGNKDTISMDNLAKALGIEGKGDFDGSMVWDAWKAGEFDKVLDYNKSDVVCVRDIHKRLTFGI